MESIENIELHNRQLVIHYGEANILYKLILSISDSDQQFSFIKL